MTENDSYLSACDSDSSLLYYDSQSDALPIDEFIVQRLSPHLKNLNVCHINAQSVPQHFTDILETFSNSPFNAILISESWLKPNYPSTACSIPGYILIRNDRVGKGGGGVAIYLRSNIPYKVISASPSLYHESLEYLLVEIIVGSSRVVLGVIYCPPTINYFPDLESLLFSICSEYTHHIIMGDFNTDLLKINVRSRQLQSIMTAVNLSILPLGPTHVNFDTADTWIDLIVVSSNEFVCDYGQYPAPAFSRHDLIFVSYRLKPLKAVPKIVYMRNFAKLDMDLLQQHASLIDWSCVINEDSLDGKITAFNRCVTDLYDAHAPIRAVKMKRPPAPWITQQIRMAMGRRDRAFNRYKNNRSDENWRLFKTARNRCNQMVRAAKRRYIHSNVLSLSSPDIWKFLTSIGICKTSSIPSSYTVSPDDLNRHFSSVSSLDLSTKSNTISILKLLIPYTSCIFNFSLVDGEEIRKTIFAIKSKAIGPDDIGRDMIIRIIDCILPMITHIINYSLTTGTFPTLWRKAFIIPLPKVSFPTTSSHFRPISILPFLSKILEAIVHKQLSLYVNKINFLSSFQSGFRPGHSTTTALLKIVDDARGAMDESRVTILVLIDFSNAFNTVDHDLLLTILEILGFSSSARDWFSSYLRGRQQAVRIDKTISCWCDLLAGVPQGGILSPLLFSIFINLITTNLNCSYHLYADDLQLYVQTETQNINSAVTKLNDALTSISDWSNKFGVAVNPLKCQSIIIGSSRRINQLDLDAISPVLYNNMPIPYQHQVKDLGLYIDRTLTWTPQVDEVCKKVNSILRMLYRHKNFLPSSTKLLLIQSLVLPIIDYADVCYSDISVVLLNKLDRLLNNCIRFIFGLRKYDHISYYRFKLRWLTIKHRRNLRILCTLFSILHDPLAPVYLKSHFQFLIDTHNRQLRSNENLCLRVPSCRTDFFSHSFAAEAVRLWNALPTDIRKAPNRNIFKRLLKTHFLAQA